MPVEKIDQVTINVKNLSESLRLFSENFGMRFLDPVETTVAGKRVRFAFSPIGLGLAESDPPEEEGFRAIGFKVSDVKELIENLGRVGIHPSEEMEVETLKEAHYRFRGIFVTCAEYPDPPPSRIAALTLSRLQRQAKQA